jgi:anaerobic C4-dicarboxylate transporter
MHKDKRKKITLLNWFLCLGSFLIGIYYFSHGYILLGIVGIILAIAFPLLNGDCYGADGM